MARLHCSGHPASRLPLQGTVAPASKPSEHHAALIVTRKKNGKPKICVDRNRRIATKMINPLNFSVRYLKAVDLYECATCDIELNRMHQYEQHMKGKSHQKELVLLHL